LVKTCTNWIEKYRCIQYNRLGAERLLILNIIQSLQTVCLVPSLWYPTSVVMSPGVGSGNKLSVWVDSDFASDIDTGKSVTGYLMVLNGGPISWKASRQGGVTLISSEAEFVAASQAGQEVLYLWALLEGFAYLQHNPTEIWEDNASCILMRENPTNCERSRHVDVRVHFLRDVVRDGSVKLIKCAGTQNVAYALTARLLRVCLDPLFTNTESS
jgi:hypothetical protein